VLRKIVQRGSYFGWDGNEKLESTRIYSGGPFTSKLENFSKTAFPRHPIYKMI
jgi:hypothetical protein